jgi:hypothetical protein
MNIRPELNFDANALYGMDTVGLGVTNGGGPTLESQVVGGFANPI